MKRFIQIVVEWFLGDPRDYAPSNANFLGFAIPALMGLAGSIFKKKSQDKASNQAYQQQQQQQQWEMQQRQNAIQQYNTQRQQSVQGKRDLLKAYLTSKGMSNHPMFQAMGGFDQFFSRPISGLQDAGGMSAAPIFKPQGSSWWDVGGQALGAAGGGLGQYFGQKAQNNQFGQAKVDYNFGGGGGSPMGFSRQTPFGSSGQGTNFSLGGGGGAPDYFSSILNKPKG